MRPMQCCKCSKEIVNEEPYMQTYHKGCLPHFTGYWISVEERLPDWNQHVLAYRSSGGHALVCRKEGGGWNTIMLLGDMSIRTPVTHWMPLPAAPEEKA